MGIDEISFFGNKDNVTIIQIVIFAQVDAVFKIKFLVATRIGDGDVSEIGFVSAAACDR